MSTIARGITVTATAELVTEECCRCGVLFAMPADLKERCRDNPGPNGRQFYCPNGHSQHYTGKSKAQQERERADQLARQLDAARAYATAVEDQAAAAERSNRALRAVNTRTRRRIAAGVCPCCRRSFADLAAHMAGQHPDYAGGYRCRLSQPSSWTSTRRHFRSTSAGPSRSRQGAGFGRAHVALMGTDGRACTTRLTRLIDWYLGCSVASLRRVRYSIISAESGTA